MKSATSTSAEKQLSDAYQRMWDSNDIEELRDVRIRLFRLVLCSMEPLTLSALTDALRIDRTGIRSYSEDLRESQVMKLCANFLRVNQAGTIEFIHDSGRYFIQQMKAKNREEKLFNDKENNLHATRLFISVMETPTHPIWKEKGLDPENDTEIWSYPPFEMLRRRQELDSLRAQLRKGKILYYLAMNGLTHSYQAADQKSIFDNLWKEIAVKLFLVKQFNVIIRVAELLLFHQHRVHLRHHPPWYAYDVRDAYYWRHFDMFNKDDISQERLGALAMDESRWGEDERYLDQLMRRIAIEGEYTSWDDLENRFAFILLFVSQGYIYGTKAAILRFVGSPMKYFLERFVSEKRFDEIELMFLCEKNLRIMEEKRKSQTANQGQPILELWYLPLFESNEKEPYSFYGWFSSSPTPDVKELDRSFYRWLSSSSRTPDEKALLARLLEIGVPGEVASQNEATMSPSKPTRPTSVDEGEHVIPEA